MYGCALYRLSFDLMEQMFGKNGMKKVQLLPARNDEHGGVIVELQEPMDSNVFYSMLRASLVQWRLQVCSFCKPFLD